MTLIQSLYKFLAEQEEKEKQEAASNSAPIYPAAVRDSIADWITVNDYRHPEANLYNLLSYDRDKKYFFFTQAVVNTEVGTKRFRIWNPSILGALTATFSVPELMTIFE